MQAPRLGELLIEERMIDDEQLGQALQRQRLQGGRIGTNLVELELLSVLELGRMLARQRGLPEAHPRDFMSAPARLLEQFPRDLAARLQVFPLQAQSRVLQLAMIDPRNLDQIAEVTRVTGLKVKPLVAPELRMVFFLEQRLGIARPDRFRQASPPAPAPPPAAELRHPVGVEAGRQPTSPGLAPAGRPEAGRQPTSPGLAPAGRPEAGRQPTSPGLAPLSQVPSAASASPFVAEEDDLDLIYLDAVPRAAPEDDFEVTVDLGALGGSPGTAAPEGLVAVCSALERARDRNTVAALAVRPVLARHCLGVLFLIRDGTAVALAAHPSGVSQAELQRLELPVSAGSLLQRALAAGELVCEPASLDPLQRVISGYLRAPAPGEVCVLPVVVGRRVVNLLCVQLPPGTACSEDERVKLRALGEAISVAYLRLIRDAKLRPGR